MNKIFYSFLCVLFLSCASEETHGQNDSAPNAAPELFSDTSSFIRVYVDKNQNIILNGNFVSIKQLEQRLQEVKAKDGLVLYTSDDAKPDPPKVGNVAELFKKYRVGIQMYKDKNFKEPFY